RASQLRGIESPGRRAELATRQLLQTRRYAGVHGRADQRISPDDVSVDRDCLDVHAAEVHHGGWITLQCGLAKQLKRPFLVLHDTQAIVVERTELILRIGGAAAHCDLQELRRLRITLRNAEAVAIQGREAAERAGTPVRRGAPIPAERRAIV